MRFDPVYRPVEPIATPFETLDVQEADVRAEFPSVSEQEIVLALLAAGALRAEWVGLDRSQLEAWANRLRWKRVGRIMLNRLLVVLTLGLVPKFWKGTFRLVDEVMEDIPKRVHGAVMALHARGCVKLYGYTVCPTSTLVDRLARACEREP